MSRQLAQQRRRQREALNAAERRSIFIQEETQRLRDLYEEMQRQEMQRLRDREMMAQFVEVFAPEPELVPFPGAQLDLVPTPMPFVPEAPPNG